MAKTKYKERDEERTERPTRPRPANDAYVMMLVITFFAILVGCVMLYKDYEQYGAKAPPKEVIPALNDLGSGKAPEAK